MRASLGPSRLRKAQLWILEFAIRVRHLLTAVWVRLRNGYNALIVSLQQGEINWDYWGVFLALVAIGIAVAYTLPDKHPYAASAFFAVALLQLTGGILFRRWPIALRLGFLFVLVASFCYGEYAWIKTMTTEHGATEKPRVDALAPTLPKVAIIQGEGGFGDLHREAIKYALQAITLTEVYCLDCAQPLSDIKRGKPDPCIERLQQWLDNQDIVAVIAPSATETTKPIIDTVNRSGYKVPVFVTSAAPRSELQWPGLTIPVFRLSSGIDERAQELSKRMHYLVDRNVHVLFLVEHNLNTNVPTYGEHMEESIRLLDQKYWFDRLNDGTVSRLEYQTGKIDQKCSQLGAEIRKRQVIFFLGIGDDFVKVVDRCYGSTTDRAKLLGFMNAYAVDPSKTGTDRPLHNIFEITDLHIHRFDSVNPAPGVERFEVKFGDLSPAVRDQAFSYDVGTILLNALQKLHQVATANPGLKYSAALAVMTQAIQDTEFDGITGHIRFDPGANTHSQNALTQLTLTRYDPLSRKWVAASTQDLLRFAP